MDIKLASKSEFAALCGVSKARVSQWIAEAKIGPEEMEGQGRSAKIKVVQAAEKLKLRLDPGQRFGNGLGTNLTADEPATPQNKNDSLDRRLKEARLLSAEAQNRKEQEDEKVRMGIYVPASYATDEATHIASTIVQAFEAGSRGLASEIATKYHLSERDLLHFVQKKARELRAKIANSLKNQAAALPELVEVEEETDEQGEPHERHQN